MAGQRTAPRTSPRGAVYVPVFTLYDLQQETGQTNGAPVIVCTGCGHDIPAPPGSARIQCRDCGRKMQIQSITPTGDRGKAGT